jgi:hypothetical protein
MANIGLEFKDISSEKYREYIFPYFWKGNVRIKNPLKLHVSESGGHRIIDAQGKSHYIPNKWVHLWWKVKPGCKHFDF